MGDYKRDRWAGMVEEAVEDLEGTCPLVEDEAILWADARITALETALSDCVRHMTHAGSPDGLVAQVNGQRVLEGKKPRKREAIIREAMR